jgi:hypothetical protein
MAGAKKSQAIRCSRPQRTRRIFEEAVHIFGGQAVFCRVRCPPSVRQRIQAIRSAKPDAAVTRFQNRRNEQTRLRNRWQDPKKEVSFRATGRIGLDRQTIGPLVSDKATHILSGVARKSRRLSTRISLWDEERNLLPVVWKQERATGRGVSHATNHPTFVMEFPMIELAALILPAVA